MSPGADRTRSAIRQRAAAGIGRSLDPVSGPWYTMLRDGWVLGIGMHVLRPDLDRLIHLRAALPRGS